MSRALPRLFLAALVGVGTVLALALAALGTAPLVAYLLLVTAGTFQLVRRSRTARRTSGRTCDCCTSTVYDPVTVVEGRAR